MKMLLLNKIQNIPFFGGYVNIIENSKEMFNFIIAQTL